MPGGGGLARSCRADVQDRAREVADLAQRAPREFERVFGSKQTVCDERLDHHGAARWPTKRADVDRQDMFGEEPAHVFAEVPSDKRRRSGEHRLRPAGGRRYPQHEHCGPGYRSLRDAEVCDPRRMTSSGLR